MNTYCTGAHTVDQTACAACDRLLVARIRPGYLDELAMHADAGNDRARALFHDTIGAAMTHYATLNTQAHRVKLGTEEHRALLVDLHHASAKLDIVCRFCEALDLNAKVLVG